MSQQSFSIMRQVDQIDIAAHIQDGWVVDQYIDGGAFMSKPCSEKEFQAMCDAEMESIN
jgi:hypothetical protein